jgi:hypothetical protein
MLITMDKLQALKQAHEQLAEAQQLIGIAIEKGKLSPIERDLVLDKIRRVYNDIIFEKPAVPPVAQEPKVSLGREVIVVQSERVEMVNQQEAVKPKEEPVVPKVEVKAEKPKILNVEPKVEVSQPQPQGEILADKFKDNRKYRNESIGSSKKDVASKMQNKPITDLTKSIGINDKFLYTKELFGGNAELYKNTINTLNEFSDINDALIYVQENFHWDENNEAASQLLELVRRKLLAY